MTRFFLFFTFFNRTDKPVQNTMKNRREINPSKKSNSIGYFKVSGGFDKKKSQVFKINVGIIPVSQKSQKIEKINIDEPGQDSKNERMGNPSVAENFRVRVPDKS